MPIVVKRVYEKPSRADGTRVLVDRLWPRGMTKQDTALDAWLKELAPSDELRHWFHAYPQAWAAFRKRYLKELSRPGVHPHPPRQSHRGHRSPSGWARSDCSKEWRTRSRLRDWWWHSRKASCPPPETRSCPHPALGRRSPSAVRRATRRCPPWE